MGDPNIQGDSKGTGGEPQEPKIETVSKDNFDKLQTQITTMQDQLEAKTKELDNTKLELLSPDYVAFLSSKKEPSKPEPKTDIDKMSNAELIDHMTTVLESKISGSINQLSTAIDSMRADAEVKECAAKYPDFWDFKQDMINLVKENSSLPVENAYKLAKQNKKMEKEQEEKEAAAKATSEKPGGPSSGSTTQTTFEGSRHRSSRRRGHRCRA